MSDYVNELAKAIRYTHGANASHVESVPVTEVFRGKTIWEGHVEVFTITGHPRAKQCFAWGFKDGKGWQITAVLCLPPVTSPETAVKVAIAAHARQAAPLHSGKL